MKAIGSTFCIKIAPIPNPEASVSTTNVSFMSGKAKTGVEMNVSFNAMKVVADSLIQMKASSFNSKVTG